MNTEEIFEMALQAANLTESPKDSGVAVPKDGITKAAFGVDIDTAEVMLARELGCECVITHHPSGRQRVEMHQVMDDQIQRMVQAGVPINKAEKALAKRKSQIERSNHVTNYDRAVNSAELLGMGFMSIHSPADYLVEAKVQQFLDERFADKPETRLQEVVDALLEIPEYQKSASQPKIRLGSPESYAGRIFVAMAGGTSGGADVYKAYFEAGVGTMVLMHVPEDVLEAVTAQNIGNIIIAGHMASDSLGINQIIAALEQAGLEVVRMSGVIKPC